MSSKYKLTRDTVIIRVIDGASIPPDTSNRDYAEYLAWLAAGGVPDPVDPPDQRQIILDQITAMEASVTNRRLREAALTDAGRAWLADVDAQIAALRAQMSPAPAEDV